MRSRWALAFSMVGLALLLPGAEKPLSPSTATGAPPATQPGASVSPESQAKLVVHEWGVMVRSTTLQGTVLGPATPLIDGLPKFVGRFESDYTPTPMPRVWTKPVIHFYGPEGTALKVTIGTPLGRPTVYWPKPTLETPASGGGIRSAEHMMVRMHWEGKLSSKPGSLQKVDQDHWWKTARDIPSLYFTTADACERFIFYEATARKEPTVTATISTDTLTMINADSATSGKVLVIVNDGAKLCWKVIPEVPAHSHVKVSKTDLLKAEGKAEQLLADCRDQWTSFGMTGEEAAAIVAIWKDDLTKSPGFLLVSRMPPAGYEMMFPMTIEPKPSSIVRAGVILDTIPGQADRLSWLPSLNKVMDQWAKDLDSDDFKVRQAASRHFAAQGDLAKPYLEKLVNSPSAELASAATALLQELKPTAGLEPILPVEIMLGND